MARIYRQAVLPSYCRGAENVDIKLTVHQANGPDVREAIGFLGKLPSPRSAEDSETARQREDAQNKLKSALDAQEKKTQKLEKDVVELKVEMHMQQLRRLKNQVPDKR